MMGGLETKISKCSHDMNACFWISAQLHPWPVIQMERIHTCMEDGALNKASPALASRMFPFDVKTWTVPERTKLSSYFILAMFGFDVLTVSHKSFKTCRDMVKGVPVASGLKTVPAQACSFLSGTGSRNTACVFVSSHYTKL